MALSAVSICNKALILLGAEPISSLTEDSKEARVMNRLYEQVRDELLFNHPWNFAIRRAELAQVDDEPEYEFDAFFEIPDDCLRIVGTNLSSEDPWKVEGQYFYCNSSTVKIKYIARIDSPNEFSVGFGEALAYKLAHIASYSLAQSSALSDRLAKEYLVHLRDARSADAQEGSIDKVEANEWLYSRY